MAIFFITTTKSVVLSDNAHLMFTMLTHWHSYQQW